MSNQVIHWYMLILPWITTFFMTRTDFKRYMPVALLAIVTATIVHDIGINVGFWVVQEKAFLFNEMLPYFYGVIPVLTMWIFKFTYGRFWTYMMTNTIVDIVFTFYILNIFFPSRGIYDLVGITSLQVMPITLMHAVLLYGYQMWEDSELVSIKRSSLTANLQPVAAKPLSKERDEKKDRE